MTGIDNGRARFLQISIHDHASVGKSELVGAFSVPVQEIVDAQKIEDWFSLVKDKAFADPNWAQKFEMKRKVKKQETCSITQKSEENEGKKRINLKKKRKVTRNIVKCATYEG